MPLACLDSFVEVRPHVAFGLTGQVYVFASTIFPHTVILTFYIHQHPSVITHEEGLCGRDESARACIHVRCFFCSSDTE